MKKDFRNRRKEEEQEEKEEDQEDITGALCVLSSDLTKKINPLRLLLHNNPKCGVNVAYICLAPMLHKREENSCALSKKQFQSSVASFGLCHPGAILHTTQRKQQEKRVRQNKAVEKPKHSVKAPASCQSNVRGSQTICKLKPKQTVDVASRHRVCRAAK